MNYEILLVGINARYTHTSLGLRYLYANLQELQEKAHILEFVINENAQTLAEKILQFKPKIVAIGVYIWNVEDVVALIEVIKKVSLDTTIILGGPEVSHKPFRANISDADIIIQGEAEITFYETCKKILDNQKIDEKIIRAKPVKLKEITLPYDYYTQHDISYRYIYVEASRGCPFECEFCLSSLDEKIRTFNIDNLLESFEMLWQKGARNFKFIDRTFNMNIRLANKIIDFFLAKKQEQFSLHFEVIPDSFPEALKERIQQFEPHTLQFEIGIQTLNPEILYNIQRVMDLNKVEKNLYFLENETNAHLHVDLIVGLPGESLDSFANNLNTLKSMTNSEIQIGILKKLSGTTLYRHDNVYNMVYSDKPPYDILKNQHLDFNTIQDMKRFARFWDLTYNSGNFYNTIDYLFKNSTTFDGFYNFSKWIYTQTESTWKISLNRLSELLFNYITQELKFKESEIADSLIKDIARVNGRSIPKIIEQYATHIPDLRAKKLDKYQKRQQLKSTDVTHSMSKAH